MNTRKVIGLWLTLILVVSFLGFSASQIAAQEQPRVTISPPKLVGVGAIRSIAVGDSETVFVAVENPVASFSGGPTSYILRTTDGGKSFASVGNFDPINPNRPVGLSNTYSLTGATNLILATSPNFSQDKTLFLVVVYPAGTSNQIFVSKDGGEAFQLLGGVYFPSNEVIRTIAIARAYSVTTDYTVAIGTTNPTEGEAGNLYLYISRFPYWQKVTLGDPFYPVGLDFYALKFTERFLVAIATPDAVVSSDRGFFYEYRFRITADGLVILPDSPPNRVRVGELTQSYSETAQRFSLAFPNDWAPGTSKDTNLVAYSGGESYPAGNIFRRTGTTLSYEVVYTSSTVGWPQIVMMGNSQNGTVLAAGEVASGQQVVLVRSTDGGRSWSKILGGVDGTGKAVIDVVGSVYVGTNGTQGGVFKSSNGGYSWRDCALYSGSYTTIIDWLRVNKEETLVLMMGYAYNEGALFKTSDAGLTWQRVRRLSGSFNLNRSKIVSPAFAKDSTVYLLVGAADTYFVAGQILKSENAGSDWIAVADPSETRAVTLLAVADVQTIIVQLSDNTIVYSFDGGGGWQKSVFSPPGQLVSIEVSPDFPRDGTLTGAVKNTGQVFISRDKGVTWSMVLALTPTPTPTPTPVPAGTVEQLASIVSRLVVVWGFDAATQSWLVYDPKAPQFANNLRKLERGKGYWIQVTEKVVLYYRGHEYQLFPRWNLIGWLLD